MSTNANEGGLRAVAVVIAGRLGEETHAFDGNAEGRTVCGLQPDSMVSPSAYKIVRFTRCRRCEGLTR